MTIPLHKMVNGNKIYLTPEEESEVRQKWKKAEEDAAVMAAERKAAEAAKAAAMTKMELLGFSSEELKAIGIGI